MPSPSNSISTERNCSHAMKSSCLNPLWPSDAIWSTLVQIMACCLTAPSHYLNQCWLITSEEGLWHSPILLEKYLSFLWVWKLSWLDNTATSPGEQWVNSLWPGDTIWRHGTKSILAQVMACCLTAPNHYLNQCWLIISEVPWHSPQGIIIRWCEDTYQ